MHPLSLAYYMGYRISKAWGLRRRKRLPYRTLSIGNISVGGTGKTPATIAVAEEALRRGFSPVILTRGYKGSAKGPVFVSKGEGPLLDADEAGDEPFLMAARLRGVPIVKGTDRYEAGMLEVRCLERGGLPQGQVLFILDDGFQHWRLHRDADIVLVDSQVPFLRDALLPIGRLREPPEALGRADVIVITKCAPEGKDEEGIRSLEREIRKYNSRAPLFRAGHSAESAILSSGEGGHELQGLEGSRVFGFCGLARPGTFRETLISLGAEVAGFASFPDHHRYSAGDMEVIRERAAGCGAERVVTTEKDAAKLGRLDLPGDILIIRIAFSAERGFFDAIFAAPGSGGNE